MPDNKTTDLLVRLTEMAHRIPPRLINAAIVAAMLGITIWWLWVFWHVADYPA